MENAYIAPPYEGTKQDLQQALETLLESKGAERWETESGSSLATTG